MVVKNKIPILISIFLITCITISYFSSMSFQIPFNTTNTNFNKADNAISVVSFNTIVADWANNVLGNVGRAEALVSGSTDIHTYTYTSADVQKVANADIFIKMGVGGLEPNVDALIDAAKDINPSLYVFTLKNATSDPDFGISMKYDPLINDLNGHFWMSPEYAKILVKKICANFTDYTPANQTAFENNRDSYLMELDQLLWRIGNFSAWYYKDMKVVIMHPAFFYLFDLLKINRTAVVEKIQGVEPSAADIANIIDLMNSNHIKIIVANPQHDDEAVIQIARSTGSKIAYLTPLLGVYGLTSYIDMIDYDLFALSPAALRDPPVDPFSSMLWLWILLGAIALIAVIILLIWRYRGISNFKER